MIGAENRYPLFRITLYLTCIEQLEDQIARLKTTLETTRLPRLEALIEADIARLATRRPAEIASLVAALSVRAAREPTLRLLISIKGIGIRTALAIRVRLPEIGARAEAAALAGLAPWSLSDDDRIARRTLAFCFSACLATKPVSTFVGHAL